MLWYIWVRFGCTAQCIQCTEHRAPHEYIRELEYIYGAQALFPFPFYEVPVYIYCVYSFPFIFRSRDILIRRYRYIRAELNKTQNTIINLNLNF